MKRFNALPRPTTTEKTTTPKPTTTERTTTTKTTTLLNKIMTVIKGSFSVLTNQNQDLHGSFRTATSTIVFTSSHGLVVAPTLLECTLAGCCFNVNGQKTSACQKCLSGGMKSWSLLPLLLLKRSRSTNFVLLHADNITSKGTLVPNRYRTVIMRTSTACAVLLVVVSLNLLLVQFATAANTNPTHKCSKDTKCVPSKKCQEDAAPGAGNDVCGNDGKAYAASCIACAQNCGKLNTFNWRKGVC
ncbi:hypothetical protein BV898_03397 [Hypsibius exemplaris]|uniref:Kazal-like domain-containing protein n=1 Tax=Hypsibius exemplaris TaxID=2072580 RepID=A0A1W0X5F0_HYPEX|nr:hypothetical protein BV898_03397 [Hypsibius exemplaris]